MVTKEFAKALRRLEEALSLKKDDIVRDSVIQRFEFTVELAWKTAKKVLGLTATAPRVVIREMAQQGVIKDPQLWFDFLEARNLSAHTYKEELAEKVYSVAKAFPAEAGKLLKALNKI